MSDRDYLYGHVCAHGSLARSCQVCDLEALLDEVQVALTWAEAPVRHDGGHLSLVERVRWLHLRGRDRHRERDTAQLREYQLRDAIREHMDASYDPPSVADMGLWSHIVDLEDDDGCECGHALQPEGPGGPYRCVMGCQYQVDRDNRTVADDA